MVIESIAKVQVDRRCPRCGGYISIEYEDKVCLNCGYRREIESKIKPKKVKIL